MKYLFISDKLVAKHECWLIGDNLLNKSYRYLQEMNEDERHLRYLHKCHDVTAFMMSPLAKESIILKLRNCLAEALNTKTKMPRLIILVLDDEIMKLTHSTGEKSLQWLYNEITRGI